MDYMFSLKQSCSEAIKILYDGSFPVEDIVISQTRREFDGDYTIVVFPFTKIAKKGPEQIANELGDYMRNNLDFVDGFNVIKGFLNLELNEKVWLNTLNSIYSNESFGQLPSNGKKVMVEFSSPNTNKPLHLGHLRNIFLGWSCSKILEAAGYEVFKTQIINNRGIAICKSMLAWQLFGEGKTPESEGIKGDHFVGDYYVLFQSKLKEEYSQWQTSETAKEVLAEHNKDGLDEAVFWKKYQNQYFNQYSHLGNQAKEMLLKWEDGDVQTIDLWNKMNEWVYSGYDKTYNDLGVDFDGLYYESDTYLVGKKYVVQGLKDGLFYEKEDGSIWVDLEAEGMDQKILLRSDGTSVYMTQDIGTAKVRYEDHQISRMVYVVANEQDYHFKALFALMKKLNEPYAEALYHLSYGMVELPDGKMKSREGTVVDADDLISAVLEEARAAAKDRGEIFDLEESEQEEILKNIGMAALKFFIIKVNPKKRIVFIPEESVDMQGQTGPYIQNAYVRIQSVLRKAGTENPGDFENYSPVAIEVDLIKQLLDYEDIIRLSAKDLDPSNVANYCYDLAKNYHKFYQSQRILKAESEEAKEFRLQLSKTIGITLEKAMNLLGIDMPNRM